jgi:oligopeptidase B
MIDASIPLTAGEWVEWGNPNEEKYFQYMMEYSPMNNVKSGAKYPSCWLTGGLHDPRVQFWEPTKFAATLRHESNNGKYSKTQKCLLIGSFVFILHMIKF